MVIPDALFGVIIGGTFGFLGVLTGIIANVWLDVRRARRGGCARRGCAWWATRSKPRKSSISSAPHANENGRASGWWRPPI